MDLPGLTKSGNLYFQEFAYAVHLCLQLQAEKKFPKEIPSEIFLEITTRIKEELKELVVKQTNEITKLRQALKYAEQKISAANETVNLLAQENRNMWSTIKDMGKVFDA